MKQLTPEIIAALLADKSLCVITHNGEFSFLFTFKGKRYFAYSEKAKILVEI